MLARVEGGANPQLEVKANNEWTDHTHLYMSRAHSTGLDCVHDGSEHKSAVKDPKGSELLLGMLKPEEIRVEDIRGSDVQIDLVT